MVSALARWARRAEVKLSSFDGSENKAHGDHLELAIIPNLITLMRLLLVVPVAVTILKHEFGWTLAIFAIASISDGVDGFLARRYNWISRFGAILEPVADKLLLMVTFILLAYTGHLPIWLASIVIGRDLVIVAGATTYHILFGEYEFAPSLLGKLSTSLQFVLVLLRLLDLALVNIPDQLITGGIWLVFVVSSVSGVDYVIRWGRKAIAAYHQD